MNDLARPTRGEIGAGRLPVQTLPIQLEFHPPSVRAIPNQVLFEMLSAALRLPRTRHHPLVNVFGP